MSLARNDMLTTGNNRAPRARRSCYVDEPAFGFFVAGSTHKQMNGLYIRRNVPRPCPREHGIILYYEHMDSGWTMLLADCEAKPPPSAWGYERQAENAWFFVDPRAADRFTHPGETIVPGAGVRWKHVHSSSGAQAGRSAASGHGRSSQLATAEADDEDELPWQVIAILDHDILRQLAGGAEYHKQRVAEALAGHGVVKPPALTSLEGCYLPGGVWGARRERKGCHPPRGVLLGSGMRLSVRGVPPSRPFDTPRHWRPPRQLALPRRRRGRRSRALLAWRPTLGPSRVRRLRARRRAPLRRPLAAPRARCGLKPPAGLLAGAPGPL